MNSFKTYNSESIEFMGMTNVLNAAWDTIKCDNELGMIIYADGKALEVVLNNLKDENGYGAEAWNGQSMINTDGDLSDIRTYQNIGFLYQYIRDFVEGKNVEEIEIAYAY